MGNLFAELKRRHIYRVAAAYVVVAWVLVQVVNNLAPMLKLPDWVGPAIIVFLLVGFPVALIFAWIHELKTPESGAANAATSRTDTILIAAVALVITLIVYEQAYSPGPQLGVPTTAAPGPAAAAGGAPSPQTSAISVAVLPFANMSGDTGQEFFSDGMTEEITTALAKVQGLVVIGRTSAFEFKGQNRDLRAIGQQLGVTHLIEGSVRKDGNRVRISAQLIVANNGAHLWAENYDRNITDIFATQEDIAQSIAGALKVPLGLQVPLVSNRTKDPASYEQYLRAKALYRARMAAERTNDQAVAVLEALVARETSFAPAWALLGYAYARIPNRSAEVLRGSVDSARALVQSSFEKAEAAARKAIASDPRFSGGYGALANVQSVRGNWLAAEDGFKQALALDPNDPEVLDRYRNLLAGAGRIKEILPLGDRLHTLEPADSGYNVITAGMLNLDGQSAAAIRILEQIPPAGGRNFFLAYAYASVGRYTDAADMLLLPSTDLFSRQSLEDAARMLRSAPAQAPSQPAVEGLLSFSYAYVGALPRVMEYYERSAEIGYFASIPGLWLRDFVALRNTERFKAFVRKAGLVDYWKARGWPDHCRPIGADDFVCG